MSASTPADAPAPTPDRATITTRVDSYANAHRLTRIRTKQLLKAALGAEEPAPPALGECCGSSCDPCVKDLWREERDLWRNVRRLSW
jgi:hypothetical protein